MNIISSVSGLGIASCFILMIFTVIKTYKTYTKIGLDLNKYTLSYYSANKQIINKIRLFCFFVAILIPFFLLFLPIYFNKFFYLLGVGFSVISSTGLTIAAITLNEHRSGIHHLTGGVFFLSMIIIQMLISYEFLNISPFIPYLGLLLGVFQIFYILFKVSINKIVKFNGIDETVLMVSTEIWLVLFSVNLLFM